MVLVLVVHTVSAVTAKVPYVMIQLLDHVRVKRDLPPELRCRQVFPTSGLASSSLWDVTSVEVLRLWLDENLPAESQNNIYEVQEDFAYGISAELARVRAAERVTHAVHEQISGVDARYNVSEQATTAFKAARDATQQTAAKATAALSRAKARALENENHYFGVAAAASTLTTGWKQAGKGLASGLNYIKRAGSSGSPQGDPPPTGFANPPQHYGAPPGASSQAGPSALGATGGGPSVPGTSQQQQQQQHSVPPRTSPKPSPQGGAATGAGPGAGAAPAGAGHSNSAFSLGEDHEV